MENRYGNSNWRRLKIAWLFEDISSGTTPSSTNDEYYKDGEIPWVNTGDLTDGKLFSVNKKISRKAITDYPTLKVHPKNSLIVALYGATIGKLAITQFDVTTNQACCVLNKPRNIDIDFVFYWFLANREGIIQRSVGGGQKNISQGIIRSLRIDVPSVTVQNKIINFLDQKTSEIDTLILDKEKLIALLEEKRQATITEVVTKGLNPDVKMKDSGVKWIGEIPEHWEKNKFKRTTTYIKDGTHGSFARIDDGYPLLSAKNVVNGEIVIGDAESHISSEDFFEINKSGYLKEGCLLLTIVGTLGRAAIYSGDEVAFQRSVAMIGINHRNYNRFIYYVTQGGYFKRELELRTKKSAQSGVYLSDLALIPILLPPLSEQIEISKQLDNKVLNIENLIKEIKTQIKFVEEYRQALIYEAVTGKIDVQEMVKKTEQEEVSSS